MSVPLFVLDCVAQLVEQPAFNQHVLGSSPSAIIRVRRILKKNPYP